MSSATQLGCRQRILNVPIRSMFPEKLRSAAPNRCTSRCTCPNGAAVMLRAGAENLQKMWDNSRGIIALFVLQDGVAHAVHAPKNWTMLHCRAEAAHWKSTSAHKRTSPAPDRSHILEMSHKSPA